VPTQARRQTRLWRRYRKLFLRGKFLFSHAGEEAEKAVEALETMKLHFERQVALLGPRTQGETQTEAEGEIQTEAEEAWDVSQEAVADNLRGMPVCIYIRTYTYYTCTCTHTHTHTHTHTLTTCAQCVLARPSETSST
jgi:hypothetical protein